MINHKVKDYEEAGIVMGNFLISLHEQSTVDNNSGFRIDKVSYSVKYDHFTRSMTIKKLNYERCSTTSIG